MQVLENVKEMWFVRGTVETEGKLGADVGRVRRTEAPKGKGKKPINKDRFVSKMCTSSFFSTEFPKTVELTLHRPRSQS